VLQFVVIYCLMFIFKLNPNVLTFINIVSCSNFHEGDLSGEMEDELVEQLCWGTGRFDKDEEENEDDEDENGDENKSKKLNNTDEDDENEPLALLVVHAAMHMLFLPQFTCDFFEEPAQTSNSNSSNDKSKGKSKSKSSANFIPQEEPTDKEMRVEAGLSLRVIDGPSVSLQPTPTGIVWCAGCGIFPEDPSYEGQTRKYDRNRIEVLRLLLATCSDPLFCAAEDYNPVLSRWLDIATAADAPNASCLFYSLLNTVMSFEPSTGGGIVSNVTDASHLKLVELSLQILIVLLDCGAPGDPEPQVSRSTDHSCVDYDTCNKNGFNIFRILLARIRTRRELSFLFDGIVRLLKTSYEGKKSGVLGGGSSKYLQCHQEVLILLWKLLEENPLFLQHILTQMDVNELVVPMCFMMFVHRRDPARIGLVHICTFILLKLSGERSFGVNVNKPCLVKLPCELPLFTGSHADLIGIVLHKLIVNGAFKLVPLYSCFITVIANMSPYWRSISLVASVKMVNLFELFSSPKFLFSSKLAYKNLSLLLEVFNNMIQYQYTGNQHLVYALIRRKDVFGRLASLNLSRAQSQCEKVYGVKVNESGMVSKKMNKKNIATVVKKSIKNKSKSKGEGESKYSDEDDSYDDDNSEEEEEDEEDEDDSSIEENRLQSDGYANEDGDDEEDDDDEGEKGYFTPTEDWLNELKATLPLETVTRLLQHLIPVVDELCSQKNGVVDETEILEVLKDVTLVGLLPVPHAIVIRKYQPNQYTSLWFTGFMWGVLFLRCTCGEGEYMKLFDGDGIQLFQVANTGELLHQH